MHRFLHKEFSINIFVKYKERIWQKPITMSHLLQIQYGKCLFENDLITFDKIILLM